LVRTLRIDQREIQRIGGRVAKYPTSYVVVSMLERYGLYRNVLDVTYGQGRFYYWRRPKLLVGVDPKVWDWVVEPDIFIPRTVWGAKRVLKALGVQFDVIVCDPPAWNPNTHYNRRDLYSYIIGSADMIVEKAVELARELGIKYMLLHFNKLIDLPTIEDVEFTYIARYLNNPDLSKTTHFTLYKVVT